MSTSDKPARVEDPPPLSLPFSHFWLVLLYLSICPFARLVISTSVKFSISFVSVADIVFPSCAIVILLPAINLSCFAETALCDAARVALLPSELVIPVIVPAPANTNPSFDKPDVVYPCWFSASDIVISGRCRISLASGFSIPSKSLFLASKSFSFGVKLIFTPTFFVYLKMDKKNRRT